MAPLPENNTPRLFLDYRAGGANHTLMVRPADSAGTESAEATAAVLALVMKPFIFPTDSIYRARYSEDGSNVSFPIAFTPQVGVASGTLDTDKRPAFLSATGRSGDGRDVKMTIFSPLLDPDTQGYRLQTPSGVYQDVLDALDELAGAIRTISNGLIIWNSYLNLGYNAYWQRKQRRSA